MNYDNDADYLDHLFHERSVTVPNQGSMKQRNAHARRQLEYILEQQALRNATQEVWDVSSGAKSFDGSKTQILGKAPEHGFSGAAD